MTSTSSPCIDLSFTSNLSLITKFNSENFLYTDRCRHIIVFSKMNLNVLFPAPYSCEVWGYNKAEKEIFREA